MTIRLYFGLSIAAVAGMAFSSAAHAALSVQAHAMSNVSCVQNVCTATAPDAIMSYKRLQDMLANADVTLVAGNGANDIEIAAPLGWASAHRLIVDAPHSIAITRPVNVTGTGALTLTTNDGSTGGTLTFPQGSIHFWDLASSLIINGKTYVLVGNLTTLASDITAQQRGNFALAANYDAMTDGIYRQAPITSSLLGNFEGLGNTISRLNIRNQTGGHVALFAEVDGQVSDLRMTQVKIIGHEYSSIGAIAGQNYGVVAGVSVQGSFTGGADTYTGGGVGINEGTVRDVYANVQLTARDRSNAGGIVGSNRGTIERSSTIGSISADNDCYAGGIVGTNSSIVRQSFSSAAVTAHLGLLKRPATSAGGVAGLIASGGAVTDSYSTGSVTGGSDANAGGLIGASSSGAVSSSYAAGRVSAGSGGFAGGVLGDDFVSGTYTNTYWDTDTTGISNTSQGAGNVANDPGLTGLTTSQLQSGLPAGFDPSVWGETAGVNSGLPYLLANPPQ